MAPGLLKKTYSARFQTCLMMNVSYNHVIVNMLFFFQFTDQTSWLACATEAITFTPIGVSKLVFTTPHLQLFCFIQPHQGKQERWRILAMLWEWYCNQAEVYIWWKIINIAPHICTPKEVSLQNWHLSVSASGGGGRGYENWNQLVFLTQVWD